MALAPSGWRKLAPLRRQARLHRGFLFLPVLVADEAVARQAKAALASSWRTHAWAWQEVSVPWTAENAGEPLRMAWTAALDQALTRSPPGTAVVLDLSSSIWRDVPTDLAPWLNQRREPLRIRDLQLVLFWPADLKEALSSGAPDLWSVRAMNPLLTHDDLGPEPLANAHAGRPVETASKFAGVPRVPRQAAQLDHWLATYDAEHTHPWEMFANIQALLELGRAADALTLARQAHGRAAAAKAQDPESLRNLSISHSMRGDAQRDLGQLDEARASYDEALKLHRGLRERLGDQPIVLMDLSISLGKRGDMLLELDRPEEAREAYAEVLRVREAMRGQVGDTVQTLRDLALSHRSMGHALQALGDLDEARRAHARSLSLLEAAHGMPGGDTPMLLRDLALSHARIGDVLHDLGLLDEALVNFRQSLAQREDLRRQLGENAAVLREIAGSYSDIGDVLRELGKAEEARQAYAACLALLDMQRHQLGDTPQVMRGLSIAQSGLGDSLRELGRVEEARSAYAASQEAMNAAGNGTADTPQTQRDLSVILNKLGDVWLDMHRPEDARAAFAEALALRERMRTQSGAETPRSLRDLAVSHTKLGMALAAIGQTGPAHGHHEEAMRLNEVVRKLAGDTPTVLRDLSIVHCQLGDHLQKLNRAGESRTHWLVALNLLRTLHAQHGESLPSLMEMRAPLERLARSGDLQAQGELHALMERLNAAAPDHPHLHDRKGAGETETRSRPQ
jgi:tetratricopeptide (TPR) repeat protein